MKHDTASMMVAYEDYVIVPSAGDDGVVVEVTVD
jgi:hypothetical protein